MSEPARCPVHDSPPTVTAGGKKVESGWSSGECHVHCSDSAKCWSGPSRHGYESAVLAWNLIMGNIE